MADLWFLPSASNVNLMKITLATVNGGSNYDSLKVAKCLVIWKSSDSLFENWG